jgi:hypothetical protein
MPAIASTSSVLEDSPAGGPKPFRTDGYQFRLRPTGQWARLAAGRSDDLGTVSD